MSLAAIVMALFIAAAPGYVSGDANAMEKAPTIEVSDPADIRDPVDIRIAKGKLSGRFENRPLSEVLDAIRSKLGFQYQGDEFHLRHPVSGTFKEVPFVYAVKKILEPFNYIVVHGANGVIKRLHIVSLKRGAADSDAAAARDPLPSTSLDSDFSDTAPELEMDRLGEFEPIASETGPNDPYVGLQDLPEIEPAESETGPNGLGMRLQELPELVQGVNETDPNDLDVSPQSLRKFGPVIGETDPNDSNTGFQVLPEFAPNVNN